MRRLTLFALMMFALTLSAAEGVAATGFSGWSPWRPLSPGGEGQHIMLQISCVETSRSGHFLTYFNFKRQSSAPKQAFANIRMQIKGYPQDVGISLDRAQWISHVLPMDVCQEGFIYRAEVEFDSQKNWRKVAFNAS
uniref:Uncharacterized protein n=1 Tax=Magnetococcus massalia (strain MO-1) TaxID=451514 RepID=A0A1S7LDU9_MAGMO|nr:Exported protein of unknown function [Candidatus Magnetococcus massalia]